MGQTRSFFRYNTWDVLPALGGVGILALLLWTFLEFDNLSIGILIPAFFAVMWSYCWNLQCVSHNFIHNPFFTSTWLNRAYSVMEAVTLGVPQILYHHYHMNHHFGDNDRKGPDGTTKDWSSIYRYGENNRPEGFWKYVFVSFFRVEVGPVVGRVFRRGREEILQLAVECLALAGFWAAMLWFNWRYFVLFYLPSYYLGWVLSYAEGYLEHYGCQPGNVFANSVSSYNRLYNLLWFNNGYHQEHHWNPKVHWTRMSELHRKIKPQMDANGTRVIQGPHITALIEDWWKGRKGNESAEVRRAA